MNHNKIYEAFPMDVSTEDGKTDSSGFCLYLDRSLLAADGNQIEILTDSKDPGNSDVRSRGLFI